MVQIPFLKLTVNRVVFEEVHQIVDSHEGVVDGHNLSLASVLSEGRSESKTTDSSESVDSKLDNRHGCVMGCGCFSKLNYK